MKNKEHYKIGMPVEKGMCFKSPVTEVIVEVRSVKRAKHTQSLDVEVFQKEPVFEPDVTYWWSVPLKKGTKSRFDLGGWYLL